jgi:glycosyltransferase involved in cell wall biosynthesis
VTAPDPDLVSVIIPTYNRAELLMQALESARNQTWPHTQIIVVDDGSTDDTPERMAAFPDVQYVRQPNRRQPAARNEGLRHAEGAYICTLDSDDLWQPEFLAECVPALKALNADFVFANWGSLSLAGERSQSYFERYREWDSFPETDLPGWRLIEPAQARTLYIDACVSPSSALVIRREVLQRGWTETFKIADDWCMLLDAVVARSSRVAFTMKPLWVKRVVGDNIYDRRHYLDLRRDFYVHDYRLILQRFNAIMTPRERGLWHGRLAANQTMLALTEGKRKRYGPAAYLLMRAALDLLWTRRYAPDLAAQTLEMMRKGKTTGLWLTKPRQDVADKVVEREDE